MLGQTTEETPKKSEVASKKRKHQEEEKRMKVYIEIQKKKLEIEVNIQTKKLEIEATNANTKAKEVVLAFMTVDLSKMSQKRRSWFKKKQKEMLEQDD